MTESDEIQSGINDQLAADLVTVAVAVAVLFDGLHAPAWAMLPPTPAANTAATMREIARRWSS